MPDENHSAVRISNLEIFNEVRLIGGRVDRVAQTLEENVRPALVKQEVMLEEHERQLLALNVKFYGVLGGVSLAGVIIVLQALGVIS